MRSLLSRARSIYRDEGAIELITRFLSYYINKFAPILLWSVLPKSKTLRAISQSRFLTSLYFFLTGRFYREQRAILCGVAKYTELEEKQQSPQHRIIRNIHRIEKGLSMRNRRSVFAEGYIKDLVEDVVTVWDSKHQNKQMKWAVDVLAEYFEVVDKTSTISEAYEEFKEFIDEIEYTPGNRTPIPRRDVEKSSVTQEDLKALADRRSSTRWFQQRNVPRNLIDESLEVAMQSPSACNRQSYEFKFYDDPDKIEKISSLAIGASGYDDNIPCLAVIVGKQRAYFDARDKHVIYIDSSLAAMAFQFSLETQGLASCCINWPAIPANEDKISEIVGLDDDEQVIMLMAIGFPDKDGLIPYSEKKPVNTVRTYNEFGD